MPTLTKINGRWRAQVRLVGHKPTSKWFPTKAAADAWGRETEERLKAGKAVHTELTVAAIIASYRSMRQRSRPISDSSNEYYMLRLLERNLGARLVEDLTPDDLRAWAQQRADEGAGPYTINMELSKLGTVLLYGAAGRELRNADITKRARPLLHHLGLIGGGGRRDRRPTEDELLLVIEWLEENKGKGYADAVRFAALTAMRRGEITTILWKDVDTAKRLVGCWRKHPRKNKVWELVPLIGPSWDLLVAQPRAEGEERIFPIHEQTLSKYFKEACDALGIPDLHFHDLRHEGTSRLFEQGYEIQEVALVTGHKDWRNLRRYTNLKPESLSLGSGPGKRQRPARQPNDASHPRRSAA